MIKNLYNAPGASNPTSLLFADQFDTNVYAAFGSVDYAVTDSLKAGLALRYDSEDRKTSTRVPTATDPITGARINPGQATGPITNKSANFSLLEPKISLSWVPTYPERSDGRTDERKAGNPERSQAHRGRDHTFMLRV